MGKKVLVIDDSLYMRTLIKDALSAAGYDIVGMAGTGESGIDMAFEFQPDIITLDNILPDMLGIDILKVFKEEDVKAKVVMISAVGQQSVVDEGIKLGAMDYIVKPFTSEQLVDCIKKIA
jgi:two-component system, chemotaxis family, chemotaxis protein CheY